MKTGTRHAAARAIWARGGRRHSARTLMRSLEAIGATHSDQHEVLAVCQKWAHRLSELERQASTPALVMGE